MRYEYVPTLQQQQNCISTLEIVYCSEHESQRFVNMLFRMYKLCSSKFCLQSAHDCCTIPTYRINLINSPIRSIIFRTC